MVTTITVTYPQKGVALAEWASINANEVGDSAQIVRWEQKIVQATGTFDGETVTMQGSLDGSNWFGLTDLDGSAAAFAAAGMVGIRENPLHVRPSVSNGGGAPDLRILLVGVSLA